MNKPIAQKAFVLLPLLLVVASCGTPSGSSTNSASASVASTSSTASSWDGKRVPDTRNLDAYEFTQASLTSTDALGRTLRLANGTQEGKTVGMFYFLWHGAHETGIYDITQLLANDPTDLWSTTTNAASPVGAFHYWGEPLYGYYRSEDPWVIARHLELLTMAGVDYLVFDTTNAITYAQTVNALATIFTTYQNQGWKVPKFAFYTHSNSAETLSSIYETWYKPGKFSSLWYEINGKPLIIGVGNDLSEEEYALYTSFFTFKEAQWPDAHINKREGFPWMDWGYPQTNYAGTMSVSLAQHPGYAMSEGALSNWGRGFDFATFKNDTDRVDEGSDFQQEWNSVYATEGTSSPVTNAFVTGWNEWMAIKQVLNTDKPIFCDTFDEEYSRDIEMMKGGYGDNYYLQLAENVRRFKGLAPSHFLYEEKTIDINDATLEGWAGVKNVFEDFAGEATIRDAYNCAKTAKYSDTSARNDIVSLASTHDANNLYLKIECLNAITTREAADEGWMNILLNSFMDGPRFASNFDYVINRHPEANGTTSIERCLGDYAWEKVGSATYTVAGKTLQLAIPLAAIGKSEKECHLALKACDHLTHPGDISDYYVSGDSAPIGRLSYDYGY